ncbi:DNA invertase Pin-like site-specific DNA recombinase [Bacillus niacini]|uniref:DNA invertase Pin-like site-specific DNA recombinase n=1 Tax=Neobacillus niacini TaxID=86668 RepID=A0A852TP13_9BACI|nr:recombinase family protein [Neobacillus niacini]NYE08828.1 DNA invertase Pin-like site-specific DNA recombinase [Neobacillus niacini]
MRKKTTQHKIQIIDKELLTKDNRLSQKGIAANYVRVSTNHEEQETSIQNQTELCSEYIEEHGWKRVIHYEDICSGRIGKRPAFKQLLADMEKGFFKYIVVKEGSRLTRNTTTANKIKEISEKNHIHLFSVDGQLNTKKYGYDNIIEVALEAQKEAMLASKRSKSGLRMKAKRKEYMGSIPPYGYKLVENTLVVREDASPNVVKRIFNDYLEGKGAPTIAKELQTEGIPTPSMVFGKRNATANWRDTSVYSILRNEHYIGNLVSCKESTTVTNEKLYRIKNQTENVVRHEDVHEAIITSTTFGRVQEILASKPQKGQKEKNHLYSHILFCSDCSSNLVYRKNWNKGSYICGNYSKNGVTACSNHAIQEKEMSFLLSEALVTFLKSFDLASYLPKVEIAFKKKKRFFEGRKSALENELRVIEDRMDTLTDFLLDKKKTLFQLENKMEKLQNELEVIKESIEEIQKKILILEDKDAHLKLKNRIINFCSFTEVTPKIVNMFVNKIDINEKKDVNIQFGFRMP